MANYFNRSKTIQNKNRLRPKITADNSAVEESSNGYLTVEGKVLKVQTGSRFQVEVILQGATFIVNAHLCGKLKMHKIRIVAGDIAVLEILVSDLKNGTNINARIKQRKDPFRNLTSEQIDAKIANPDASPSEVK